MNNVLFPVRCRLDALRWETVPADLDPDRILRIEVVKGEAAIAAFGPEAVGGAIQIFTKEGAKLNAVDEADNVRFALSKTIRLVTSGLLAAKMERITPLTSWEAARRSCPTGVHSYRREGLAHGWHLDEGAGLHTAMGTMCDIRRMRFSLCEWISGDPVLEQR